MKNKSTAAGHVAAFITILIWGTTFISTKVLLRSFEPVEILLYRFAIGFLVLFLINPRRLKLTDKKQEFLFAAAGLSGVTLYFLLENIALTYSMASNVGVIISAAPFFTAILVRFFEHGEKPGKRFYLGFGAAILGIILISFNGSSVFKLNPLGDLLAVIAAFLWAVYSILTRKISAFGYSTVQTTRHIFFYGLLFMIPALFFFDFHPSAEKILQPGNLLGILYLGLGASALCFVTWNFAVKLLGAVKTSVYIYLVPVITVVTSALVLHEKITLMAGCGTVLTLLGLVLSEQTSSRKKHRSETDRKGEAELI
ncbi:DMT family transporter [Anaerolentibacter hominis]|uniref:DMT family transporter n=1 Tax=Anaerolentibacter hominis TaxID=3079009 RepID=UPI0031B874FB